MAKIILVDDNGNSINSQLDSILTEKVDSQLGHDFLMKAMSHIPVGKARTELLASIKHNFITEFMFDRFHVCDCGNIVLSATLIEHTEDGYCCQNCDDSIGTQRYNELMKHHTGITIARYFAGWQAAAELDDDVREELIYCYTQGITVEPAIVAADIKNQLNRLNDEDWHRVKRDLED